MALGLECMSRSFLYLSLLAFFGGESVAEAKERDQGQFLEKMLEELRSALNIGGKLVEVEETQDEFGYAIAIKYHGVEIEARYGDDVYDVSAAASCCFTNVAFSVSAIVPATIKDAIEAIKARASYAVVAYAKALKAFAESVARKAIYDDSFDIAAFAAIIIIDEIEASIYALADFADILALADEKREVAAMADSLEKLKDELKIYAMGNPFGSWLLVHKP